MFLIVLGVVLLVVGVVLGVTVTAIAAIGPVIAGVVLIGVGFAVAGGAKRRAHLEQVGIPGRATVLGLTDTGVRINDAPRVQVAFHCEVPGYAPFQTQSAMVVPLIGLGRLTPGASVPIKVDPTNFNNLIVEWGLP
jgi:hypothetical protein